MESLILGEATGLGDSKWLFILALIIGAITFLNAYGRKRRAALGSPRAYSREVDSATRQSMVIKKDLESLLFEINELSRTINGQLDTRFAKLEISIADADRRIAELRSLLIKAGIEPDAAPGNSGTTEEVGDVVTPRLDLLVDDQVKSFAARPEMLGAAPNTGSPVSRDHDGREAASEVSAPTDAVELFHREVQKLADDGHTPVEIAERTRHAVGEVELVLHLQKRAMRRSAAVDAPAAERQQHS